MANLFLEDPNNLGKVVNGWNPQNVVFNRETALNGFITNLTVQNFTGGSTVDSFANLTVTNLKNTSVMTGNIVSFSQVTTPVITTNVVILPSASATTPYTGAISINNSQSGQVLYISSLSTSPFNVTFPSSPQNGFKYEVIANGSFTKPVTLVFPANTLNGTILCSTGSGGFPANQRFTGLTNCMMNGTGMSQAGDHYFINTDTTNYYISGICALGNSATTS